MTVDLRDGQHPLPAHVLDALSSHRSTDRPVSSGRVVGVVGLSIEVAGLRGAVGDACQIELRNRAAPLLAEIVGFRGDIAIVMAFTDQDGIAPGDRVVHAGQPRRIVVGDALRGRIVDALGNPLDDGPPLRGPERALQQTAPSPLQRAPIDQPFATGVSAIDGFMTCGRGQRLGIFAGSGVGKSTLMGSIARGCSADVNVIALIGERGREVGDFVRDVLGEEGLRRSVVVAATSDAPPMQRFRGPFTAVAIAEAFRNQGRDVLFLMDSVTRFAGAVREVGLASGEPPTLRGYPPSLFAHLPRLVERLGNDDRGSITGLLTVLVDGDDFNEPVSDALRGYLDGHLVLSRQIAHRGRYPAIDVLASVSRLMTAVTTEDHRGAAEAVRAMLATYEENRDLVAVGAYRQGADPKLDAALQRMDRIEALLKQGPESRPLDQTVAELRALAV